MSAKIAGVVIGSRKCGTTWLYRNFQLDPGVSVSRLVKESGFFARADDLDFDYYEGLFPHSAAKRVEVDSSLAYSDVAADKIFSYNPEMRIVLILRDPIEYAVSRYLHMLRKGQLSEGEIVGVVRRDTVLLQELDYPTMIRRFQRFQCKGNMLIIPYSLLVADPIQFYAIVRLHLVGPVDNEFEPQLDRVNVARSSRWTLMSQFLSRAAVAARKRRLHVVVNFAKSLNLHRLLDRRIDTRRIEALRESVSRLIRADHGSALAVYRNVEMQIGAD